MAAGWIVGCGLVTEDFFLQYNPDHQQDGGPTPGLAEAGHEEAGFGHDAKAGQVIVFDCKRGWLMMYGLLFTDFWHYKDTRTTTMGPCNLNGGGPEPSN